MIRRTLGGIPDQGGNFTGTGTISAGTGKYQDNTGPGTFGGTYGSSSGSIAFLDIEFNFTSFTVDPSPLVAGCDPLTDPTCNPNPNPGPGATPELDSVLLFGTGLVSGVGYLLTRRRAARSTPQH